MALLRHRHYLHVLGILLILGGVGCSVSDAADDPVRRLTLRQQLGQMLMVRFEGAQPKVWDGAFR